MRILVVEDEHRIANTIKKGLEQERHAVDVVYDGTEGLDMATAEEYDLIILDRMLPGMDGLTLCRRLRNEGKHTPVLMLTAKTHIRDRVDGLDAGADDYLIKPFSFEELLARIRALSRRPKTTTQPVLQVGDLSLNTLTYEVKRSGVPINISSKEFSLLEYLMSHANQIVNKNQIIQHVWNYDADILPNTVEVYIRNLRNKIDAPFENKPHLIHTVRGFGYKFSESS